MRRSVPSLAAALMLCACSSLPHDGPTGAMVGKESGAQARRYAVVDLTPETSQIVAQQPAPALIGLTDKSSTAAIDQLAEGDTVAVSIFEAGASGLFSRPSEVAAGNTPQTFPRLIVDERGMLSIPFAGDIHVAGLTPHAAAQLIRQGLQGKAVDPQVTVTLVDSRINSVAVLGEVRSAGHVLLAPGNDRLLDVLTSAGGPTRQPGDVMVTIVRNGQSAEVPYVTLLRDPAENIRLAPRDQVRLLYRPRKYSSFGALTQKTQTSIEDEQLTLAGAIARAGGLDPNSADSQSVLVFRFERPEVARALGVSLPPTPKGTPVVYRLNVRDPGGLFVANSFEIRADDVLYVPRARMAEARQFLDFVNVISQTAYNVRVTSVLP